MLLDKTPHIRVFKLVTGEEIIAKVTATRDNTFEIEQPRQPMTTEAGVQLVPYMFMIDPKKPLSLNRDLVIMDSEPTEKVKATYESIITGIAVLAKPSIITGV